MDMKLGPSNSQKFSFFKLLGITPQVLFIILFGIFLTGIFIGLFVKNTTNHKKVIKKQKIIQKQKIETSSSKNLPKSKNNSQNNTNTPFYKNSLKVDNKISSPVVAIIIDDMGIDMLRSQRILNLEYPLTTSYLSYAPNLQSQINFAKKNGKEVMLHVPMQAYNNNFDYGGKYLSTELDETQNIEILENMLTKASGIIGINNHMGSKFTSDYSQLYEVMKILNEKGLAFIDSKTINKSKGDRISKEMPTLPYISRDVFLDDSNKDEDIKSSLKKLEDIAKKKGYAVAIGHPRDNTISNLKEWLPLLKDKGIELVPISYIIQNKK